MEATLYPAWFLVATHSFLVAVKLNESLEVVEHVVLDEGHHYGIALPDPHADPGFQNTFIAKSGNEELSVRRKTPPFEKVKTIPLRAKTKDVHQIAATETGLYVANTGHNQILLLGYDGDVRSTYAIKGKDRDVNHVNSVFRCGHHLLVLLHNNGDKNSEVCVLDTEKDRIRGRSCTHQLWSRGAHNVLVNPPHLFYNASYDQHLVRADLSNGTIDRRLGLPGHTKGMSLVGNALVVGVSDVAERGDRPTSSGRLAIVDRADLTLLKLVDINFDALPHPVGNINEIRCLSSNDLAHAKPAVDEQVINWEALDLNASPLPDRVCEHLKTAYSAFRATVRWLQ